MFEYESPFKLYLSEISTQFENDVMIAVRHYGISVDKDELIRALRYDRDQYSKGYQDAKKEVIHCIDCRYACIEKDRESDEVYCSEKDFYPSDDFFCGYAKQRK